ncbi:MoaD/ThiS family protein [Nocardioides rubriscoriae]|uniref:MoaD/ThiS family protein n=1 Tax=Nocardioides rubriscoriae TaxID=642762 RepID=UPI0011DF9DCF|nr:MoaD/ThiS family protein [Nocardioides rubriscoriae]
MSDTGTGTDTSETQVIHVRYWASAREAAGTDAEQVVVDGPLTLTDLVRRLVDAHGDDRFRTVVDACSVLVGDRPVRSLDPATVVVEAGQSVEFLPPFAGG